MCPTKVRQTRVPLGNHPPAHTLTHQILIHLLQRIPPSRCPPTPYTRHPRLPATPPRCCDAVGKGVLRRRPFTSSFHADAPPFSIPISPVRAVRLRSAAAFAQARTLSMRGQSGALDWDEDWIPGPDVSKRETLLLLAKMTTNAYVEPNTDGWMDGWMVQPDQWVGCRGSSFYFLRSSDFCCWCGGPWPDPAARASWPGAR